MKKLERFKRDAQDYLEASGVAIAVIFLFCWSIFNCILLAAWAFLNAAFVVAFVVLPIWAVFYVGHTIFSLLTS